MAGLMIVLMTVTQARIFGEARTAYIQKISRMKRADLADIYRMELADRGRSILLGGPSTKDELISALVELRYPNAKHGESIHVLYHTDGIKNEVCEYCYPDPCPKCGALQGHCEYSPEHGGTVNGRHINA